MEYKWLPRYGPLKTCLAQVQKVSCHMLFPWELRVQRKNVFFFYRFFRARAQNDSHLGWMAAEEFDVFLENPQNCLMESGPPFSLVHWFFKEFSWFFFHRVLLVLLKVFVGFLVDF